MKDTIVHHEGAASLEVASNKGKTFRVGHQDRFGCARPALRGGGAIRSALAQAGTATGAIGVCAMGGAASGGGSHGARGL